MAQEIFADGCSICVGSMGRIGIIEAAGEIDMASVSLLAKALNDAVESGYGDVVLDAQKLTYIDSAGLRTLLSTSQQLASQGRKFAIAGCHGIFYKLMKISQLDRLISMYPSVEEVVAELEG